MTNLIASEKTKAILENLVLEKSSMAIKAETIRNQIDDLKKTASEKTAARDQLEQMFLRDQATPAQVEAARVQVNLILDKLTASERLQSLASASLQEIDQKIAAAQVNYEIARRGHLQKLISELSEDLNTKIRSQIIAIRAAECLSGIQYPGQWELVLKRIFPQASIEEIGSAAIELSEKHGLNQ